MDIPARVLKDKRLEQSEAVERLERLERLQFYFELLNLERLNRRKAWPEQSGGTLLE